MKYQGYECPVCEKRFTEGDDVVVCPVCGAPHHRACYKEHGGCSLEQLHTQGKTWAQHVEGQAPQPEQPTGATGQTPHAGGPHNGAHQSTAGAPRSCPSCGAANPSDGVFCQVCGTMLGRTNHRSGATSGGFNQTTGAPGAQGQPYYGQPNTSTPPTFYANLSSPYAGLNPEEQIQGVTVKELSTYVGPSSNYYLPRFKAMEEHGSRAFFFHWSAFFFNFVYFFYRKIYKVAIPLLILFAFSMVPTLVYSFEYMKEMLAQYGSIIFPLPVISTPSIDKLAAIANFFRMIQLGASAVLGFTANRLYLSHCATNIRKLKGENQTQVGTMDTGLYIQQLTLRGGVSTGGVAIVIGALVVIYFITTYLMSLALLS